MTFHEYLDQNEEKIRSQLSGADDADRIKGILDDHLGRMLVLFNEESPDPLLGDAASALVQTVRSCLNLMDVHGQVRIWQRVGQADTDQTGTGTGTGKTGTGKSFSPPAGRSAAERKNTAFFFVLLIAGILLLTGSLLFALPSAKGPLRILELLLVTGGGGAALYGAGLFHSRSACEADPDALSARVTYDSDRILRQLRRILLTMDRTVEELSSSFSTAMQGPDVPSGKDLSGDEDLLLLFSDLLEASYSKDGDYALDELGQVRHFLHRRQIELSDDTAAHREWFEYVPTASDGVLRPALIRAEDETLLKKGLAGVESAKEASLPIA